MTSTIFVAGGAGGVGQGVVRAWLELGATVVTASRRDERRIALTESASASPGRLIIEAGSSDDAALIDRMAEAHGPFDQVVASLGGGGWRLAPLLTLGDKMFERIVNDGISAHWRAAKALRPHVVEGGTYVFVNGGAALHVTAGTGPLSLVARAQLALAEILDAEDPSQRIDTVSLILDSPISTPQRGDEIRAEWLTPADVGDACVHLAAHGALHKIAIITTRDDVAALAR